MDKREELKTEAIRLFSEKGFVQTSVQEIAEAAYISKGAFYKHFDSKESMFAEIMQDNYGSLIRATAQHSAMTGLSKKALFMDKIKRELEQWIARREFFTVLFKDVPIKQNAQIFKIVRDMKTSLTAIRRSTLTETYGDDISPYLNDVVVIFEGILKEFIITIILQNKHIDIDTLAARIAVSMDAVVAALPGIDPIFAAGKHDDEQVDVMEEVHRRLDCLNGKINRLPKTKQHRAKLTDSVQMLAEELHNEAPKPFLIEAILAYLKQEQSLEGEILFLEKFISHHNFK